jgi:hypothetical protein
MKFNYRWEITLLSLFAGELITEVSQQSVMTNS